MKIKNIKDQTFGRLKVIEFTKIKQTRAQWKCVCICGTIKEFDGAKLRSGDTTSCGCYHRERASRDFKKYTNSEAYRGRGNPAYIHGDTGTKFFNIFQGMTVRCNSKKAGNYKNYGGKGIKVLWKSYLDFKKDMYKSYLKHSKEYGEGNTTIDRIDNKKGYSKENCRWATYKKQERNRCNNRSISFMGKTMIMSEWEEYLGFTKGLLTKRIGKKMKWTIEKALTTPIRKRRKYKN